MSDTQLRHRPSILFQYINVRDRFTPYATFITTLSVLIKRTLQAEILYALYACVAVLLDFGYNGFKKFQRLSFSKCFYLALALPLAVWDPLARWLFITSFLIIEAGARKCELSVGAVKICSICTGRRGF